MKKLVSKLISSLSEFDAKTDRLVRFRNVPAKDAAFMMLCAAIVGVGCGVLAVVLNGSVHWIQNFLGSYGQSVWTVFFPAMGAILAVLFVRWINDQGGHGVPEVIQSVTLGEGKIAKGMVRSRFIGSLLTVGSGGSAGLEGPIVCIGGAWGAAIGKYLHLSERRKKLLIGYGSAAAVAGIFNAPLTGIVFTLEIVLQEWSMMTILPIIVAAVTATQISRLLLGDKLVFQQELMGFSLTSLLACIALGILTGLASVWFKWLLTWSESYFGKWKVPFWLKAGLGGLGVGIIGYFQPEILAESYSTTQSFLTGEHLPDLSFVLIFLALKVLACCLTLGTGGVGGVFAPSLILGSSLGMAFGLALHYLPFGEFAAPSAFALTGMTGMLSGVMHGPLTGIFLIMEITRGYSLILPLMLTSSSAMLVNYALEVGSVYTRELIERGKLARPGSDAYVLHQLNIRDILDKDCLVVRDSMLLEEFLEVFKNAHRNLFPTLDEDQRCVGVVFLDDIRPYLFHRELYQLVNMGAVARELPTIDPSAPVPQAIQIFETSKEWALPVVENSKFLGMLSKSTLFDHYRHELLIHSFDV